MAKEKDESPPGFLGAAVHGTLATAEEELILTIDVSPSMKCKKDWKPSRLQGAKDACFALLDEKLRCRPQDHVGVVSFSDVAWVETRPLPIGTHIAQLKKTVTRLHTGIGTNISAGLEKCDCIFSGAESSTGQENSIRRQIAERGFLAWLLSPRSLAGTVSISNTVQDRARRIILLSDGCHTCDIDPLLISERLKQNGVEINCIGISGPNKNEELDEGLLMEIASRDQSGRPRYWFIGDRAALIQKFESLANSLRCIEA